MSQRVNTVFIASVLSLGLAFMEISHVSAANEPSIPWDVNKLFAAPQAHPVKGYSEPGLHAVFLDGLAYRGQPTRFFAWYGVPAELKPGQKAPAIVLVHGGGGTAHSRWVRQWIARGYAAIAIDTNGGMPPPGKTGEGKPEPIAHAMSGPKGSDHAFAQLDEPIEDQWAYHAVADIVLAHSFIRQLPQVDADRTGITGISWGGYLTCIVAGVDPRFRFAVPVYGCGYLTVDSGWNQRFADMSEQHRTLWEKYWDPARYLPSATMPMLWINGDMDGAFSLKIMQMSYRLPPGPRFLSIQPGMGHSHTTGEAPPEIPAFAEQILHGGRPLARCTAEGHAAGNAWATFADAGPAPQARLAYTLDGGGQWMGRTWTTMPATWNAATARAEQSLPAGATAFYFALTDDRRFQSSSEVVDLVP